MGTRNKPIPRLNQHLQEVVDESVASQKCCQMGKKALVLWYLVFQAQIESFVALATLSPTILLHWSSLACPLSSIICSSLSLKSATGLGIPWYHPSLCSHWNVWFILSSFIHFFYLTSVLALGIYNSNFFPFSHIWIQSTCDRLHLTSNRGFQSKINHKKLLNWNFGLNTWSPHFFHKEGSIKYFFKMEFDIFSEQMHEQVQYNVNFFFLDRINVD